MRLEVWEKPFTPRWKIKTRKIVISLCTPRCWVLSGCEYKNVLRCFRLIPWKYIDLVFRKEKFCWNFLWFHHSRLLLYSKLKFNKQLNCLRYDNTIKLNVGSEASTWALKSKIKQFNEISPSLRVFPQTFDLKLNAFDCFEEDDIMSEAWASADN